ncbi:MAG: peptidoglycan glycosyltransferase [Planctomycetota bacterium]|jgi:peptidoglycan glycosyltransferase
MTTPTPIRSEQRLGIVFGAFSLFFVFMLLRLVQLQFFDAAEIEEKVASRRYKTELIPAFRGNILDRNGKSLATTVTRYDLAFMPSTFREKNRVDALQDLLIAWCPEILPPEIGSIPQAFKDRVNERHRRFHAIYEFRTEGLEYLAQLKSSSITFDKAALVRRFGDLRHPRGELVLPPSKLKRRLEDALILIADNEVCSSRRALRLRLAEHEKLVDALATTPERMIAGIEAEWEKLEHLSSQVVPETPRAFLLKVFEIEQKNIRRILSFVDQSLDDRICAVELGTHDFENGLSATERENLAVELKVSLDREQEVAIALDALRSRKDEGFDEKVAMKLERAQAIMGLRTRVQELEPFELEGLAIALEFWDDDPKRIKRAFAKRFKSTPDFADRRHEYLSIEKEWARTLQSKGGVPYLLFRGCGFPVAAQVWRSFGLRDLGFTPRASQGRTYWRDQDGIAAQIIGRCNSSGQPLGGLELSLTQKRPGALSAPLIGEQGRHQRYQGLDGSWRTVSGGTEPTHGQDVRLTLDRDLQAKAEELVVSLKDDLAARNGAAICVIDIRTGEILVLASAPRPMGGTYLSRFLEESNLRREMVAARTAWDRGDTTLEEYRQTKRRIRDDLEHLAFYERAISAGIKYQCPPGSVLKPIAAAGLLHLGLFKSTEIFQCPDKGPVDCWLAIERSSNPYFWQGAERFGRDKLIDWYRSFGLFRPIRLLTSQFDCDRRLQQVKGDAAKNIIIGQASVSLSVLEVASTMTNLARRGRPIEPIIVKQVGDQAVTATTFPDLGIDDWIFDGIFGAMTKVAEHYVPGNRAQELGMAAKTGTAELGGKDKGLYNAWFAGFAPAHNPRFAFAVVAERTLMMGKATAPFAAELMSLVMGEDR